MKDYSVTSPLNFNEIFPFALDQFQKKAIAALAAGKSVVVCAPTGSGKTVIGEYAIYRALSRGKRVFYTTPLKALSNQKFRDFQDQFGTKPVPEISPEIGLITGDIVLNPNAPVVVMTTEIFRNMLYETPIGQVGTSLENVETVVLDECHYISDRGRGTVWEESIIYCPPTIQLVALSATIGNPEELTDWINQVRLAAQRQEQLQDFKNTCELINSNFRPVPLRNYFSNTEGLFPLLSNKQTQINPHLKPKRNKGERRKFKRDDFPKIPTVVNQLQERDMLPAIYVIFSRRGCDQAIKTLNSLTLVNEQEAKTLQRLLLTFFLANNPELQERLLAFFAQVNPTLKQKLLDFFAGNTENQLDLFQYLAQNPQAQQDLFFFLGENSELARAEQLEPLTRGIAAHHAGILPAWKELVEQLFEMGLIKVVFATSTLAAGINMPARTTVISALKRRTDNGHEPLSTSEFLQLAGRAGRRGIDSMGYVVMVHTPFEDAEYAAKLATKKVEPLKSCFTPSYGMVLNLLQKHSLEEAKDLLERSFAEYLAQLRLVPEKRALGELTTELAKLDVELAGVEVEQFASYEKLKERLKEEERLLKILLTQAEISRKQAIAPLLPELSLGDILFLKGKHIKVASPLRAVLVSKMPGSGQAPDLISLGEDNRWYVATYGDVADIDMSCFSRSEIERLSLPDLETVQLGYWRKGDQVTATISQQLSHTTTRIQVAPEVLKQQQRVEQGQIQLAQHPLSKGKNPGELIKRHERRLKVQEQLYLIQNNYQKHRARKSYYWEEFLNLIAVLREFNALDEFTPTPLGEAAAAIRSENELWLGLALTSGELEWLNSAQLAAVVSSLITEPLRPDTWTDYAPAQAVLEVFSQLQKTRQLLIKTQRRYDVAMLVCLERDLVGLVEQWALGVEWPELCEQTNLDEGDLVRLLRRTVDILWQIPQIPGISPVLRENAKVAIAAMKRFPI